MAVLSKESKPYNVIVEKFFTKIINDKFKSSRAACKYCHKKLNKNPP